MPVNVTGRARVFCQTIDLPSAGKGARLIPAGRGKTAAFHEDKLLNIFINIKERKMLRLFPQILW
jgi:hypothetical protein